MLIPVLIKENSFNEVVNTALHHLLFSDLLHFLAQSYLNHCEESTKYKMEFAGRIAVFLVNLNLLSVESIHVRSEARLNEGFNVEYGARFGRSGNSINVCLQNKTKRLHLSSRKFKVDDCSGLFGSSSSALPAFQEN